MADLLEQIRDAFNKACPDIPCARARVADVLGSSGMTLCDLTAESIADLAYDLGIEINFKLVPLKAKDPTP